jgi:hypothetical protein
MSFATEAWPVILDDVSLHAAPGGLLPGRTVWQWQVTLLRLLLGFETLRPGSLLRWTGAVTVGRAGRCVSGKVLNKYAPISTIFEHIAGVR